MIIHLAKGEICDTFQAWWISIINNLLHHMRGVIKFNIIFTFTRCKFHSLFRTQGKKDSSSNSHLSVGMSGFFVVGMLGEEEDVSGIFWRS